MKNITSLLFILMFSINVFSQDRLLEILPLENGKVVYTEIVKVDSVNKNKLYSRANKWIISRYKSAKDVIQLADQDEGIIIGKGNFGITYYSRRPLIDNTLQIEVKDGRYKITISNLIYSDIQGESFPVEKFPKSWTGKKKLFRILDEKIKSIMIDLKYYMSTELKNDW